MDDNLGTRYVTSADGTRIAFDCSGAGPPVILVSGIFSTRGSTRGLAEQLAKQFTVVCYDRRGRGESGDTAPYAVEREVEDLGALIAEVGGAAVYGHSSGAGLALNAAASGLPITRLVLHEPPYGSDDEESQQSARGLAQIVCAALDEGRPADAIALFFEAYGLLPDVVAQMSTDPDMQALAPTMRYDFEVMGEIRQGGVVPEDLVRAVSIPTLVLAGSASPDFFRDTAARIAGLLPDGECRVLAGQDHVASAQAVAPVVTEFLRAADEKAAC